LGFSYCTVTALYSIDINSNFEKGVRLGLAL
jgi:hypothetical protein